MMTALTAPLHHLHTLAARGLLGNPATNNTANNTAIDTKKKPKATPSPEATGEPDPSSSPSSSIDPTATPDPSSSIDPSTIPTPTGTSSNGALGTIISLIITHPGIPLAILAILFLRPYLWKKATFKYNMEGRALPSWQDLRGRTMRLIRKEDTGVVITKPAKLAQYTNWFTWKRYWLTTLLLTILNLATLPTMLPRTPTIALIVLNLFLILAGYLHLKTIMRRRHRILMQMFEVANAECRYPKGAELNPWGWVNITSWKDLYNPDTTVVVFPARFRSEEPRIQETFETNFNGTVTDAHTWIYKWETANNRVIVTPAPFITSQAPYPFPDVHPWDKIPLGIAAGGEEVILDLSTYPHTLIAGTTGSGKATSESCLLPTVYGWKRMGDIEIGDELFDENGLPCKVTWKSETNLNPDLYKVMFSDGSFILADAEHLWYTETRKARESEWNTKRKDTERRLLIDVENLSQIETLMATSDESSEITVAQFANIAGVPPTSGWLFEIADELGPVGEVQIVAQYTYAEQIVHQKQKVTVYSKKEVLESLAEYKPKRGPVYWQENLDKCAEYAKLCQETDEITSVEVHALLGTKTITEARDVLKRRGVYGQVEYREVSLQVPAKTLERRSAWAKTYSTKLLCEAVIQYNKTPVNDQRHKKTYGSVKTTLEILETLRTVSDHANHAVAVAKPLVLPTANLPIPPYTLGAWLGDGFSRAGDICGMDREIISHVENEGFVVEKEKQIPAAQHPDFRIWKIQNFTSLLRENNLLQRNTPEGSQKHIPAVYLRASIEQRRALLAGLLDTDGTVGAQGEASFCNTNETLARQVHELALSLGYRATITSGIKRSQNGTECLAYIIAWTCEESPFRLTRKTNTFNERNVNYTEQRNNTRFIVDIVKAPSEPARCIQVDSPSRLFLAGEAMIPTHNSVTQRTILLHALTCESFRVVLIDPKRVELSSYRGHPHVLKVATELDESTALFEQVEQEMQSRYLKMQEAGTNHFMSLPDPPPALMVMVDETFALLSPENIKSDEGKERDDMHSRCTVLIGSIARLGRAAGIHLVLATQRPDAKVIPGETRANLDARIAQGRMDTTPSLMTLDSDAATRIPGIKGRAVLRTGNTTTEFQAYFLPNEALPQVLEMSAAIATGVISAEDLLAAVKGSQGDEVAAKRRLPRIPLPGWLRVPSGVASRFSGWVERRKEVVEANESHSSRFGDKKVAAKADRKAGKQGKGSEEPVPSSRGRRGRAQGEDEFDDRGVSAARSEPSVREVAEQARAQGVSSAGSELFTESGEEFLDEDFADFFDDDDPFGVLDSDDIELAVREENFVGDASVTASVREERRAVSPVEELSDEGLLEEFADFFDEDEDDLEDEFEGPAGRPVDVVREERRPHVEDVPSVTVPVVGDGFDELSDEELLEEFADFFMGSSGADADADVVFPDEDDVPLVSDVLEDWIPPEGFVFEDEVADAVVEVRSPGAPAVAGAPLASVPGAGGVVSVAPPVPVENVPVVPPAPVVPAVPVAPPAPVVPSVTAPVVGEPAVSVPSAPARLVRPSRPGVPSRPTPPAAAPPAAPAAAAPPAAPAAAPPAAVALPHEGVVDAPEFHPGGDSGFHDPYGVVGEEMVVPVVEEMDDLLEDGEGDAVDAPWMPAAPPVRPTSATPFGGGLPPPPPRRPNASSPPAERGRGTGTVPPPPPPKE